MPVVHGNLPMTPPGDPALTQASRRQTYQLGHLSDLAPASLAVVPPGGWGGGGGADCLLSR